MTAEAIARWAQGVARGPRYAIAAFALMTTAIVVNGFTLAVFYAFACRTLPYPQASKLAWVRTIVPDKGLMGYDASPEVWRKIGAGLGNELRNGGLVDLEQDHVLVRVNGSLTAATVRKVTPSVFPTLGVYPVLGRWPSRSAGRADGPREALISHGFWVRAFGRGREALGTELNVSRHHYRVIGVLPHGRTPPLSGADIYIPLVKPWTRAQDRNINDYLIMRMTASTSLHRLNKGLRHIAQVIGAGESSGSMPPSRGLRLIAVSLHDAVVHLEGVASVRWIFLAAGLALWVLAVVNLSQHALVHYRARLHEAAVRMALGATRWRLSLTLVAEQVPLMLLIWGVSVPVAALGVHWFVARLFSGHIEHLLPVALSPAVIVGMLFLTGLGLFVAVAVPLWQMDASVLRAALGEGHGRTMSRQTRRLLEGLSIAQIALAVALMTAGLVAVTSLIVALHRPLGFDPRNRVVARVVLPQGARPAAAWRSIVHRLERQPYVSIAAVAATLPWSRAKVGGDFRIGRRLGYLNVDWVDTGFFQALSVPLTRGRALSRAVMAQVSPDAILGKGACHAFFGEKRCLGRVLSMGRRTVQVSGVVAPVSWQLQPWIRTLGTIYLPMDSCIHDIFAGVSGQLVVALRDRGAAYEQAVKDEIQKAVPGAVVMQVRSYKSLIGRRARYASGVGQVLMMLAVAGIMTTLVGIYAVQDYIGRWKAGEYRIRAVLGAGSKDFRRIAVRAVLWQVVPGCVLGAGLGFFLVHLLGGFFYHAPSIALWVAPASVLVVGAASGVSIGWPIMNATRAPRNTADL